MCIHDWYANGPDQDGLTPLHLAARNEHLEVVKALVQANSDAAKEISATGETVLHMCVSYNCMESLKVLMELWNEDELAKITDNGGNTLLFAAAINKQIEILNYLLKIPSIKANRNAVNRLGLTALDILDQCLRDLKSLETREILMKSAWARYVNDDHRWIEKQRGILIVAALVVAGLSFHSAINPPGRIISSTQNVLVLISGFPLRNKFWTWVLTIGTMFAMVFMVNNYLESLSTMGPDGYVDGTSVWICLIWMLGCRVIALIHTIFFVVWVVMKLSKCMMPAIDTKGNQDDDAGEV
ncbi:hypothetical protein L1987_57002 [Smallanthus sonchifolius]|uniref:Uncharacterized protein n=1 Tax=Smallanthus sonchifolius TaxID=185202 RepID=A0ACB9DBG3_9ASTR|nr:hypothetical protein L1987_57002 [Smallanthus sonchifolius]